MKIRSDSGHVFGLSADGLAVELDQQVERALAARVR